MGGDFQVEVDSIRATVTWMEANAIDTATKLRDTMAKLNNYAVPSDWSSVPSCVDFGSSYNAAIAAYKSVADDLLADAQKMRDALTRIADQYEDADASARARFDAAIANFAEAGYMTQSPADQTYQDHKGDLHSDDPEAAPPQDADTGASGSGSGSGSGAPTPTTTGGGRTQIQ